MIDPNNPPKFVTMPYELANAVYNMLSQMPYSRVAALMSRLENEPQPAKPQLTEVPKPSEVENVLQSAP